MFVSWFLHLNVAILLFSCAEVQMVLSMVCRRALRERDEDAGSVKLPPLLEEELALTACRLTRPV